MNVLSLFDGISCGQVALNRAGIKYQNYYASEIDKYAKKITQKNYPRTFQLGDINNWKDWGFDFSSIDLVFAGFPCQAWSYAGFKQGQKDPRGKLAWVMMDIFNHVKKLNPNVRFIFENVEMQKDFEKIVSDLIGYKFKKINSSLVSAQHRIRMYFSNLQDEIKDPIDREIYLNDILNNKESHEWIDVDRSNYVLWLASLSNIDRKKIVKNKEKINPKPVRDLEPGLFIYNNHLGQNGVLVKRKAATLVCAGRHHVIGLNNYGLRIRKLTPIECERLQTLPDNYTEGVSNSQRYKAIGNGWNVETIVHILKQLIQ